MNKREKNVLIDKLFNPIKLLSSFMTVFTSSTNNDANNNIDINKHKQKLVLHNCF